MNQRVPSWEVDETLTRLKLDYEVAELTWENGQLAMHGLGPRRVPKKPRSTPTPTKYMWDKPHVGGTLESIVNQATYLPQHKTAADGGVGELVPWFDHHHAVVVTASATAAAAMTTEALVPCSNNKNVEHSTHVPNSGIGTCTAGCSTCVGSCSGATTYDNACVAGDAAHEWSSCRDPSMSGSPTFGRDSREVSLDRCDVELGTGGFTSTSMGSPGNTSSDKLFTKSTSADDHDSVYHSKPQRKVGDEEAKKKGRGKSSVTNKRSRAAAIHNQSERKRRDKINERIKILQKLVPNSSKTDKASMLDEVIEYLKQLEAQVHMMSRMNMSSMMLPMAIQQQLQMAMMGPMMGLGLGLGMGMGVMDLNTITRSNLGGILPVLHPNAFMPSASWDGSGGRLTTPASVMPDPMATFLSAQSQPMTMEAYSRLAALYQQMHQPPGFGSN